MPSSLPSTDLELVRDITIDKAIMGVSSVQTSSHGYSDWAIPLKIEMTFATKPMSQYFIKLAATDLGFSMVRGEYESMKIFYALVPEFAVRPIAYGTCSSAPDVHYYISDFKTLENNLLSTKKFCVNAATMHLRSFEFHERLLGTTLLPEKYGFHVTTHTGMLPQDNRWQDSWEKFFTQSIIGILAFEEKTHGQSNDLDDLATSLIKDVIPRLLGPLESGQNQVKPVLVHGDLQIRNVGTDAHTGEPVMYDAGELGKWKIDRFGITSDCFEEYHSHIPKSSPEDEWEDRIILYSMVNLLSSAHYPGNIELRNM